MLGPLREDSPERIGPYGIRARLGAGGMGEVFLGVRDDGGEPVAVKTVRRDVAQNPGFRTRFRREIDVARSVADPHLAPLLDGDAEAEVPWLATEYVAGPTLSAAVRGAGAMAEAEVRMLGAGLARALAAVHGAGIVHRDVKPGNVMLAADGPRLIDFGIARDAGATALTTTSRMVGSPSFMSPEHVAGSGRVVSASDVFCLASLLCFAVTGREPFGDGPVAAVLYRVKYVETDLDGVPDTLRAVLERCLVAEPADRPGAAELAELLDPGAADRWPGEVARQIAEHERELARVVALGGPLLPGYTPTEVAAGSSPAPHQLPTQGTDFVPGLHAAPTQGPGLAAPPRRRSRRTLAVALAALIVLGAATGGVLAWRDRNNTPNAAAPGGGSSSGGGPSRDGGRAEGPRIVAGVDENGGPDASGTVPYGRDVRPAGWKKPWKGKFSGKPIGCSAGRDVIACRLTDGTYEGLSAADGHQLWTFDTGQTSRAAGWGPTGQFFMPASATRPTVHDDSVLLAAGGQLRSLDARTGTVRWEAGGGGAHTLGSAPMVLDDLVFAATTSMSDGAQLAAYDLRTGTEKWREPLASEGLAKGRQGNFWPVAVGGDVVYAAGEDGPKAFRPKDGTLLGTTQECGGLRLRGESVYCSAYTSNDSDSGFGTDMSVLRLEAGTLEARGKVPLDSELVAESTPAAVDDRVMVLRRSSEHASDVPDEFVVVGRDTGRLLGRFPLPGAKEEGMSNPASGASIVADTMVWADTTKLYTVPIRPDGTLGELTGTRLPGAPGPSPTPEYDMADGIQLDKELNDPQMLPVGGVVHVVYDDGTTVSVPLPG
ncbi:protein kinase [Streptomyces sp. NPDC057496]|uniref:protein kinase domain-containing protein n=1 Tax=Streptomyces sp. NPDC057496 TaxID=3346149 RepID=UPI0036ADEEC0